MPSDSKENCVLACKKRDHSETNTSLSIVLFGHLRTKLLTQSISLLYIRTSIYGKSDVILKGQTTPAFVQLKRQSFGKNSAFLAMLLKTKTTQRIG
jgi:hypothetical protein